MHRATVPPLQLWSAATVVCSVFVAGAFVFVSSAVASPGGWGWLSSVLEWTVPVFAFTAVGFLLVLRGAGPVIAWLCLGFGLAWGIWEAADAATRLDAAGAGSIPRLDLIFAMAYPFWVPGVAVIGFMLLLFPEGRLLSRRWRPVLWALLISASLLFASGFVVTDYPFDVPWENPLAWEGMEPLMPLSFAMVVLLMASLAAAAASLLARYRRAVGIERLQLKWLVAAGGMSAVAYPLVFIWEFPIQLVWSVIPVAIGIAILRYRLYEIDRLVSRTVTYGCVVAVLVGVYIGGVFVLGAVLPLEGDVAVAAATLAVAALFNPLRRRIQVSVDRRFNRSRYDFEREVARFAGILRDRIDPEEVVAAWTRVVSDTMQPATVGVWLPRRRHLTPPEAPGGPTRRE